MVWLWGHKACGILTPNQGSNSHPLHWKAKSSLLDHQGSPSLTFLNLPSLHTLLFSFLFTLLISFSAIPTSSILYPHLVFWSTSYFPNAPLFWLGGGIQMSDRHWSQKSSKSPIWLFPTQHSKFLVVNSSPPPVSFVQPTQSLSKSLPGFKSSCTRAPSSSTSLLYINFHIMHLHCAWISPHISGSISSLPAVTQGVLCQTHN